MVVWEAGIPGAGARDPGEEMRDQRAVTMSSGGVKEEGEWWRAGEGR